MSRGRTRVLYTLSLLLLPSVVHSQDAKVTFKYRNNDTIRAVRVMYGVMMPQTDDSQKDDRTAQPWIPDSVVVDSTLAGRSVVYGPPSVTGNSGEVKPVGKARIAWWKFRRKVRHIFH